MQKITHKMMHAMTEKKHTSDSKRFELRGGAFAIPESGYKKQQ